MACALLFAAVWALARGRHPLLGVYGLPWGLFLGILVLIIIGDNTPWESAADFLLTVPLLASLTSTGLGLFIAKGIIELHGGRMGVDSEGGGKGSTFWFELPVAGPAALPNAPKPA